MRALGRLASVLCAVNAIIGWVFSWLALGIVLVCFTVVIQRYVFSVSYLWLQDLYIWLNGVMFMAVAGYALLRDNHVRVDIFYRRASAQHKAVVDLIGVTFFLLPFVWVVTAYSLPFVSRSWRYMEGSSNVGGMPGLFVLKSFILAFTALLALQGLAFILRSILILGGREDLVPKGIRYSKNDDNTAEVGI